MVQVRATGRRSEDVVVPLDTLATHVCTLLDSKKARIRRSISGPVTALTIAGLASQEAAQVTKAARTDKAAGGSSAAGKEREDGRIVFWMWVFASSTQSASRLH